MSLPVNIDQLLSGKTVEWERLEFKEGWNPEDVLHSLCAFANDINNWGGGYIVLGIAEKDGRPVLPPKGLKQNQVDAIQRKLLEICNRIVPKYFPIVEPIVYRKKHILIIWAPGGDTRPYKAPVSLGEKASYGHYVRRFSNTVKAGAETEKQLFELAAKVPFDDRIHHEAQLTDLELPLIQAYLREIGSDMVQESSAISFEQLCRSMNIARGHVEYLRPVNVGLLFFNDALEQFFKGAKIEIVEYHDEVGDKFSEKTFAGPIHRQLKDALEYLQKFVIKEEVQKVGGKAKAERFYNYPYEAVREALANPVYHRSYEHQNFIEVNARFDCIEILSFPGPLPPVDNDLLRRHHVVARDYRNRRVGDFLKELHLTEGRGTGIPKIRRAMKNNGSPEPVFETDDDRTYFLTTLPINKKAARHPAREETVEVPAEAPVETLLDLSQTQLSILRLCKLQPLSSGKISNALGYKKLTGNVRKALSDLIKHGYLRYAIPDKPRSKSQKYVLTESGKSKT
ncbi:MAG: putative DNA binding domain-containing protein [Bacteroidetes bacterium]|nr:putative DNA binding domain-containing protein [Nitrososphaerota archaeon]MCL5266769.1 putative DNA binding domain-containing protein [Bacteroidota bacterium]